jgi:putative DNA primase/helicase
MLRQDDQTHHPPASIAEKIPEGQRNSALFREASRLRRNGWTVEEILPSLRVINARRCTAPLAEEELRQIAESAARYQPAQDIGGSTPAAPLGAGSSEPPSTETPDLLCYPYTDSGNGERLAALYKDKITFCVEMGRWLIWDGRRWAVDDSDQIGQKAKEMARLLAAQAAGIADKEDRKTAEKWAKKSESHAGITAAVKRAIGESRLPVHVSDLDQHPYLLNCRNGVVNLKTGDLIPHNHTLRITKLCHIDYDPDSQCPRFQQFLGWTMGGGKNLDAEPLEPTTRLIEFLQRAFGYRLTADVGEKVAFELPEIRESDRVSGDAQAVHGLQPPALCARHRRRNLAAAEAGAVRGDDHGRRSGVRQEAGRQADCGRRGDSSVGGALRSGVDGRRPRRSARGHAGEHSLARARRSAAGVSGRLL